jgi:hypothetical protein
MAGTNPARMLRQTPEVIPWAEGGTGCSLDQRS